MPANVRTVEPLLFTSDIQQSQAFYESLGFETTESWTPDGVLQWCSLRFGGAGIMLQQADRPVEVSARPDIELFFICEDVDSLYEEFVQRGLHVKTPEISFYRMKQLFLRDPDGRLLCFEHSVTE